MIQNSRQCYSGNEGAHAYKLGPLPEMQFFGSPMLEGFAAFLFSDCKGRIGHWTNALFRFLMFLICSGDAE